MTKKVFKNDRAKEKLEEWYQIFLSKIDHPAESVYVETSYGPNQMLKAGREDKPVLFCLHSMLTSSAHLVSELQYLLSHYQIIAPDLPGQSVRGLERRFSYQDNSFAKWLGEIVDGLGLNQIHLLGVRPGGFAALQFAKLYPERVQNLVLIVPAGIVRGSIWEGVRKMAIPSLFYQINPSEERLRKFVDPLLSTWDKDWAHYLGDSFKLFYPDFRIPPLLSEEEWIDWDVETIVFAAEDDISFPGKPMIQKLKSCNAEIQTELMADCKHSPPTTYEFRRWLGKRILKFMGQTES